MIDLVDFYVIWIMHVHGGFARTPAEAARIARSVGLPCRPLALEIWAA